MGELVDALDSKSGYRKVVQVRFLFWAQNSKQRTVFAVFLFTGTASETDFIKPAFYVDF